MKSSVIVLIAGAVEPVNDITAKRIYHAMLNHGVECEMVNMLNSWNKADRFAQSYKQRQKLGELPRVIIVRNHPVMDKTVKADACRSYWDDAAVRPTLSVCLSPSVAYYESYWASNDDDRRSIVTHLIPLYAELPQVCCGSKHHRNYTIINNLTMLLAAGKAVRTIHEILNVNNGA